MTEVNKIKELADSNKNGTNLDELQDYISKNQNIPRDIVLKYIDALAVADSKKLLKGETKKQATEFLQVILEQRLETGITVTEPETLDVFLKCGIYDKAFLEKCKNQLLEAKAVALKWKSYGESAPKVVFELKKLKSGRLGWSKGEFGKDNDYEKTYYVPQSIKKKQETPVAKPSQAQSPNMDFKDENKDGTNLDELQKYMRSNSQIPREIVLKYIEALSLAKAKNAIKEETGKKASEFLKNMLDQRLISGIMISEPETIDLYIKSGLYNNNILNKWKKELVEAKETAAKWKRLGGNPSMVVFELRLVGGKLFWKNAFGNNNDEKSFSNNNFSLTEDDIHSGTASGMAQGERISRYFSAMADNEVKISQIGEKEKSDPASYLKVAKKVVKKEVAKNEKTSQNKEKIKRTIETASGRRLKKNDTLGENEGLVDVNEGNLNIRSEKGTVVGTVGKNHVLEMTGDSKNMNNTSYLGIKLASGKTGYVAEEYIKVGDSRNSEAANVEKEKGTKKESIAKKENPKEFSIAFDEAKLEKGETIELLKFRLLKKEKLSDGKKKGLSYREEVYEDTFDLTKKGTKYVLVMGSVNDQRLEFVSKPDKMQLEQAIRTLIAQNQNEKKRVEII